MKKLVRFIGIMCFLQFILFYSCSNEAEEVNEKHSKAGKADKHIEKSGTLASACGYEVCQTIGAQIPEAAWDRIKKQ